MLQRFLDSGMKAVRKGFLHMFSANMLNQLLGFGSLLVVTKVLQPNEIGAVKIIQSYVAVCLTVSTFGFPSAIIKFCSEIKDVGICEYILKRSIGLSVFFSCVICILLIGILKNGWLSDDDLVKLWLPYYILVIIPNAAYTIFLTYMQAIKAFKKMAGIQSVLKIISVLTIIVATYAFGIGGYVISIIGMMMVSLFIVTKQVDVSFGTWQVRNLPGGFNFMVCMSAIVSILGTVCTYLDMFFLDNFISDRNIVGYYAMASMFIMIGTQFVGTVQSFLTPYFSEKSCDSKWLWQEMMRCQKYLSFVMIVISFLIYAVVYFLIHYYYGEQYISVLFFLRIMLLQLWLHTTYSILGCVLLSINKVQYNLSVAVLFILVKSILSYYFINAYGVVGFSYAQVLAEIPAIVMAHVIARRALGKNFAN